MCVSFLKISSIEYQKYLSLLLSEPNCLIQFDMRYPVNHSAITYVCFTSISLKTSNCIMLKTLLRSYNQCISIIKSDPFNNSLKTLCRIVLYRIVFVIWFLRNDLIFESFVIRIINICRL